MENSIDKNCPLCNNILKNKLQKVKYKKLSIVIEKEFPYCEICEEGFLTSQQIRECDEEVKQIEELASYAHNSWRGWMNYMFSKCISNPDGSMTIPTNSVERWTRQMNTPYNKLPEDEKKSDRVEAVKIQSICQKK
jgi:hypothetical protein